MEINIILLQNTHNTPKGNSFNYSKNLIDDHETHPLRKIKITQYHSVLCLLPLQRNHTYCLRLKALSVHISPLQTCNTLSAKLLPWHIQV